MSDIYIRDPVSGQLIPDRRSNNNMEVQQAVLKLLAKVESMETNIETKLEAVKDKISNLDEKMTNRVDLVENKIDEHCEDDDDINTILDEHDKKIENAKSYIQRIQALEDKYIVLERRVDQLQKKPIEQKAAVIDSVSTAIKNAFMLTIGASVVGFIGYLILQYIRSL